MDLSDLSTGMRDTRNDEWESQSEDEKFGGVSLRSSTPPKEVEAPVLKMNCEAMYDGAASNPGEVVEKLGALDEANIVEGRRNGRAKVEGEGEGEGGMDVEMDVEKTGGVATRKRRERKRKLKGAISSDLATNSAAEQAASQVCHMLDLLGTID